MSKGYQLLGGHSNLPATGKHMIVTELLDTGDECENPYVKIVALGRRSYRRENNQTNLDHVAGVVTTSTTLTRSGESMCAVLDMDELEFRWYRGTEVAGEPLGTAKLDAEEGKYGPGCMVFGGGVKCALWTVRGKIVEESDDFGSELGISRKVSFSETLPEVAQIEVDADSCSSPACPREPPVEPARNEGATHRQAPVSPLQTPLVAENKTVPAASSETEKTAKEQPKAVGRYANVLPRVDSGRSSTSQRRFTSPSPAGESPQRLDRSSSKLSRNSSTSSLGPKRGSTGAGEAGKRIASSSPAKRSMSQNRPAPRRSSGSSIGPDQGGSMSSVPSESATPPETSLPSPVPKRPVVPRVASMTKAKASPKVSGSPLPPRQPSVRKATSSPAVRRSSSVGSLRPPSSPMRPPPLHLSSASLMSDVMSDAGTEGGRSNASRASRSSRALDAERYRLRKDSERVIERENRLRDAEAIVRGNERRIRDEEARLKAERNQLERRLREQERQQRRQRDEDDKRRQEDDRVRQREDERERKKIGDETEKARRSLEYERRALFEQRRKMEEEMGRVEQLRDVEAENRRLQQQLREMQGVSPSSKTRSASLKRTSSLRGRKNEHGEQGSVRKGSRSVRRSGGRSPGAMLWLVGLFAAVLSIAWRFVSAPLKDGGKRRGRNRSIVAKTMGSIGRAATILFAFFGVVCALGVWVTSPNETTGLDVNLKDVSDPSSVNHGTIGGPKATTQDAIGVQNGQQQKHNHVQEHQQQKQQHQQQHQHQQHQQQHQQQQRQQQQQSRSGN